MSKGNRGRVKATWWATVRNIGLTFIHRYEGNTLTGSGYGVIIRVRLDREDDREVSIQLTPKDARKWAHALTHYADMSEGKNANE